MGGWRERGFDASFVSHGLMRAAEELARDKPWDVTDPVRWLADSHSLMLDRCVGTMMGASLSHTFPAPSSSSSSVSVYVFFSLVCSPSVGSSTICLCSVDASTGDMFAANLGDSGLIVFSSNGELRLKSESRQVEFNAPLQLAAPAPLAVHYAK